MTLLVAEHEDYEETVTTYSSEFSVTSVFSLKDTSFVLLVFPFMDPDLCLETTKQAVCYDEEWDCSHPSRDTTFVLAHLTVFV